MPDLSQLRRPSEGDRAGTCPSRRATVSRLSFACRRRRRSPVHEALSRPEAGGHSTRHPLQPTPGVSLGPVAVELRVTRHGTSLRIGRAFLRTWPSYGWLLPKGYETPEDVYLVEWFDERDSSTSQLAGFTTMAAAEECITRLESEGWRELYVNIVALHRRISDWHYDR